jgi:hypothetical protein
MDGERLISTKPAANNTLSSRRRLAWTMGIVVVGVLILGLGAAYYVRSNLPVELTRADVVGTWVRANGAPGLAVFNEDGTVSIRDVPFPDGKPETGQGKWELGNFQGPTVEVSIGNRGYQFGSKWDNFRTVLVTYSGDPDDPSSENTFVHRTD